MAAGVPIAKTQTDQAVRFPFLDLKLQFRGIREEVMQAVERVLESQNFILGDEVSTLEQELASLLQCEFAIGCASGSDALLLSLMALDVRPGEEVITTPLTFVATAGSIARLGARPKFVDIDPLTFNLDPQQLQHAITSRTRAVIPVHLFGLAADLQPILHIAEREGLWVIEDAAQAICALYGGRPVGSFGALGCFSFFPSKNLGGAGDGGLITTNNPELADKLKILRVHGSRRKYEYLMVGVNSRLDALQAAILRVKLPHLDSWTEDRRCNAQRYGALFREYDLASQVQVPVSPENCYHVFNQYTVRVARRDQLQQYLRSRGIPTEIYYPEPLHLQPALSYLGYRRGDFPETESACRQVLSLPVYPEITEAQQRAVVENVAAFYRADLEERRKS